MKNKFFVKVNLKQKGNDDKIFKFTKSNIQETQNNDKEQNEILFNEQNKKDS